MRIFKYALTSAVLILGLMATSCSDSDKWTPGPQDTNIGVSAYFEKPATTSYIFGSDYDPEDMVIDVEVMRQDTKGDASVGITLKSDVEGFSCQNAVNFAAGEASATFQINCSAIPKGTPYNVTVELAEDQTDIYGIGTNQLTFSAIKADWKLLSDQACYLYSDYSYNAIYPATYGELYQLEGTKTFKLTDFFGSGLDITFECNKPENEVLIPLQNADFENVSDYDKEDLGWYLYDEAKSEYPSWVPGDVEGYPAISYLLFYSISDYNVLTMIYNQDSLYGYIGLTVGIDFDNGDFKWGSFQVDFNMNYNPFE